MAALGYQIVDRFPHLNDRFSPAPGVLQTQTMAVSDGAGSYKFCKVLERLGKLFQYAFEHAKITGRGVVALSNWVRHLGVLTTATIILKIQGTWHRFLESWNKSWSKVLKTSQELWGDCLNLFGYMLSLKVFQIGSVALKYFMGIAVFSRLVKEIVDLKGAVRKFSKSAGRLRNVENLAKNKSMTMEVLRHKRFEKDTQTLQRMKMVKSIAFLAVTIFAAFAFLTGSVLLPPLVELGVTAISAVFDYAAHYYQAGMVYKKEKLPPQPQFKQQAV